MTAIITYQDYLKANNVTSWLQSALVEYTKSQEFKKAQMEAEYMAGRDTEIINTVKVLYDMAGNGKIDYTAANNRISSNILHRLISQRCTYSLGNGVSFASSVQERGQDGKVHTVDAVKETLGNKFDTIVYRAAYWACGNGESYTYVHKGHHTDKWEFDVFKRTEFLPLYDEYTGILRAGVRFWTLDVANNTRPITAILYTEAGYQRFQTPQNEYGYAALQPVSEITPYTERVQVSQADGVEVIGAGKTTGFPIVPLYPNESKTAALDNLKAKIDALDMALSGFANDMEDVAQIYFMVNGGLGMDDSELEQMRDRMKLMHILNIDGDHSSITPYTQEPPYNARETFIQRMIDRIYSDYGCVNVSQLSAQQRTATEIEAAFEPMNEEADAFEYQLIEYIQQILSVIGVDDVPRFQRSQLHNQKEIVEMLVSLAEILDVETIINHLPFITVDERQEILDRLDAQELADKRNMEKWKEAMNNENWENGTQY